MAVEDGGIDPYLNWCYGQYGAQWQEVTSIKTPPFNTSYAETIKAKLQQHGCQIVEYQDHYTITFPPGTQQKLVRPVTIVAAHTIRLPDGYEISEQYDQLRCFSIISVPKG
jgi:hypothetical protein